MPCDQLDRSAFGHSGWSCPFWETCFPLFSLHLRQQVLLALYRQKVLLASLLASDCLWARGGIQPCGLNALPKQLSIASGKTQHARWAYPPGHKSDLAGSSQQELLLAHPRGVFQGCNVSWRHEYLMALCCSNLNVPDQYDHAFKSLFSYCTDHVWKLLENLCPHLLILP